MPIKKISFQDHETKISKIGIFMMRTLEKMDIAKKCICKRGIFNIFKDVTVFVVVQFFEKSFFSLENTHYPFKNYSLLIRNLYRKKKDSFRSFVLSICV